MGLFFASHLYVEILAVLFLMGVVSGHAWAEKARDPEAQYTCPAVTGPRAVFFIIATVLSLLVFDMAVKEIFLDAVSYGNLMQYMASLILLLVFAVQALLGAVFVAPTRKGLVTFTAVVVTFIFLWEFHLAKSHQDLVDAMLAGLFISIIVGIVVHGTQSLVHKIYLTIHEDGKRDTRLWDIHRWYKRVFSLRFTILLFLLLLVDALLAFEGHGLLSWISLEAFIASLACIIATIFLYKFFKSRKERKALLRDEWQGKHFSTTRKLSREKEMLTMEDGVTLQGYVYRSSFSPGGSEAREGLPGPAILFLHGFGGYAQDINFEPIISTLAMGGYTVFAYDYRWSGHSRKNGQKGVFQGLLKEGMDLIEKIFADAPRALEWMLSHDNLVDSSRVAVVGFSFGGTIALSSDLFLDSRVKVVLAGCALHDLGENVQKRILYGPWWLRVLGKFIAWRIRKNTGVKMDEFIKRASQISPSNMDSRGNTFGTMPNPSQRVFLAHVQDDSIVDHDLNFVKNKEMLGLGDENYITFETGGHEFKHNEGPLGAWMLLKLGRHL